MSQHLPFIFLDYFCATKQESSLYTLFSDGILDGCVLRECWHSLLARDERFPPARGAWKRKTLPQMFVLPDEGAEGFNEVVVHVAARGAGVGSAVVAEETQSLVRRDDDGFTSTAF